MAQSQISAGFAAEVNEWIETALSNVPLQAKIGAAELYDLDVNNASLQQVYVKVYFKAVGDVTVGTTDPDLIFPVPASTPLNLVIVAPSGKTFPTALTLACTQTAGTPGTTAPSANVAVRLTYQ